VEEMMGRAAGGVIAAEGSDAICSEDMALEDLDAMLAKVGTVQIRYSGMEDVYRT
jgi:hypothetical protein